MAEDQKFGLSPKKQHEVERMCSLLYGLAWTNDTGNDSEASRAINHIVDVGAGQEYLTRNLAVTPLSFNILALDADDHQTEGAVKRQEQLKSWQNKVFSGKKSGRKDADTVPSEDLDLNNSTGVAASTAQDAARSSGCITRATVFVDQITLPEAIKQWTDGTPAHHTIPVLMTGLHACGSLTPAVLRSFVSLYHQQKATEEKERSWRCAGLALVGCCYNRIREIGRGESYFGLAGIKGLREVVTYDESSCLDIPMSRAMREHALHPNLHIESLHLHLAAQVTYSWLDDPVTFQLGMRKIVFRARVERLFCAQYGGEMFKSGVQVGRFNDAAYSSWEEYLRRAAGRLKMPVEDLFARAAAEGDTSKLVRRLELVRTRVSQTSERVLTPRLASGAYLTMYAGPSRREFTDTGQVDVSERGVG